MRCTVDALALHAEIFRSFRVYYALRFFAETELATNAIAIGKGFRGVGLRSDRPPAAGT